VRDGSGGLDPANLLPKASASVRKKKKRIARDSGSHENIVRNFGFFEEETNQPFGAYIKLASRKTKNTAEGRKKTKMKKFWFWALRFWVNAGWASALPIFVSCNALRGPSDDGGKQLRRGGRLKGNRIKGTTKGRYQVGQGGSRGSSP